MTTRFYRYIILLVIFCCIGLLLAGQTVLAQENTNVSNDGEQVEDFHANVAIATDGSFSVAETIVYNFGSSQHHGIFREIPYHYTRSGANYNVRISIVSVTDNNGQAIQYSTRRWAGKLRLTIGDPQAYVTGIHTYVVKYSVQRAINFFSDHDEWYWNLTGNGWAVPILNTSVTIRLPGKVTTSSLQQACYTGIYGATEKSCTGTLVDNQTIVFNSSRELAIGEGLSLVLGWPKGLVTEPTTRQKITWFMQDNWPILFPLAVLIFMFIAWYTRGRDPKNHTTVIPFYEAPDHLPAAAVGTIVDEKADIRDISATIIQLAIKGYLKIKEIAEKKLLTTSRDYELIKLREPDSSLRDYEKEVFEGIFDAGSSRTVSSLKNKFYVHLKKIKQLLYASVVDGGYFPTSPETVRAWYFTLGIIVAVVGFFLIFGVQNIVAGVATIVSGVVTLIFAQFMPRKTIKGADVHAQILGFKWFLSVTEKERLAFHNAPAKSPREFEELLPYAMVLGVEKEWAKQFEGMYITPPEWYEGHPGTAFGAWYLATSLGSMSHSVNTAMVTAPHQNSTAGFGGSGFGGGGFSGGGFGGGGGGSW